MKNIYEILMSVGVEIPEDKKADFDKALNENYKTVNELDKVKTARDNFKSQLDTATESLKQFEGVDVGELKGKIESLNNELANQKAAYEQQIADNEFNSELNDAIRDSGAKNPKAVRALLDVDALKSSKNRREDIKAALGKAKEENDYMFKSEEPLDNPLIVGGTGGAPSDKTIADLTKMSYEEYKKYRSED